MEPEAFYDDLAADYHLIFENWERSIDRQSEVLASLLRDAETVLDAACGIGTQAIGLARAGFAVTASDLSPAAVARCSREAAARGLPVRTVTRMPRRGRRAPHALPRAARGRFHRRRVAGDRVPPAGRHRTNFVSGDSDLANAAMSRAHASMSESWTISTGECM